MKIKELLIKWLNICAILLVMIIIFGIILCPTLFPKRCGPDGRQFSRCITNLQALGLAFDLYRDDWGGMLPVCAGKLVWGHGSKRGWTEKLHADVSVSRSLYCCPDRAVNFAYAMNRRIGGIKPRHPDRCVLLYECPGSGDSNNYPVRSGEDNWYDSQGKRISWASGDANQMGDSIFKLTGNSRCENYSWMPSPSERSCTANKSYSQLVLPGAHKSKALVLLYDGHAQIIAPNNAASKCTFDAKSK